MKKSSLIVATLISLILFGGCTAKKEEIPSNWATYDSRRFSFTFLYPHNYTLDNSFENTYEDQGFIYLYSSLLYQDQIEGGPDIQFSAYANESQ